MAKNKRIDNIIDEFLEKMDDEGASVAVLVRTKEDRVCNAYVGDDADFVQLVCIAIATIEKTFGLSLDKIMKFAEESKIFLKAEENNNG